MRRHTSKFVTAGLTAAVGILSVPHPASAQAQTINPNIQALVSQYASFHGETSVLPYSVAAEGVIYNMDLFDKVGVSSVPTTLTRPRRLGDCQEILRLQTGPANQPPTNMRHRQQRCRVVGPH